MSSNVDTTKNYLNSRIIDIIEILRYYLITIRDI